MPLQKIDIEEREELEPMLVEDLGLLEEVMKVDKHQLATPTGPLDILGVDEDGALAVLELKNEVGNRESPLQSYLRPAEPMRVSLHSPQPELRRSS